MTGSSKPNFYELYQTVGRIDGRLDTIDKNISKIIADHETRINCVEKVCDNMLGKTSVIGAITGFIAGIISAVVIYFINKNVGN